MSRVIRDWRCPDCGYVHEQMTLRGVEYTECPQCGQDQCLPMVSAPKLATIRMGADPDFPTAADKWARAHKSPAPDQG